MKKLTRLFNMAVIFGSALAAVGCQDSTAVETLTSQITKVETLYAEGATKMEGDHEVDPLDLEAWRTANEKINTMGRVGSTAQIAANTIYDVGVIPSTYISGTTTGYCGTGEAIQFLLDAEDVNSLSDWMNGETEHSQWLDGSNYKGTWTQGKTGQFQLGGNIYLRFCRVDGRAFSANSGTGSKQAVLRLGSVSPVTNAELVRVYIDNEDKDNISSVSTYPSGGSVSPNDGTGNTVLHFWGWEGSGGNPYLGFSYGVVGPPSSWSNTYGTLLIDTENNDNINSVKIWKAPYTGWPSSGNYVNYRTGTWAVTPYGFQMGIPDGDAVAPTFWTDLLITIKPAN